MRTTQENLAAHNECLAIVVNFIKEGNEIKYGPAFTMPKAGKAKKVKKTKKKRIAMNLRPIDKVRATMQNFEVMTRQEVMKHTYLSDCSVSRAATKLIEEGFMTREQNSGLGGEVTYSITGNK